MKYLIIALTFISGIIVGVIIAFSVPFLCEKITSSIEKMSDAVIEYSESILEINLAESVESTRNAKIVLLSLESGKTDLAKTALIDEIGTFYYTWTHEAERELNDKVINELLKEIETESNKSEGLKIAINFKPE